KAAEARAEAERESQLQRMRESVRHSLVLAADARTPEEIRHAQELLDETAELAKLVAPDALPEIERGRQFLPRAIQRANAARAEAEADARRAEQDARVAPPPREVKR